MNIIFDLDGTLAYVRTPIVPIVTPEMLEPLAHKYTLTIVTGSTRSELIEALTVCKIARFFNAEQCITCDEGCVNKKDGTSFLKALTLLPTGPTIVIGDSEGDEHGAHAAGLACVRVLPTYTHASAVSELQRCIEVARALLAAHTPAL